MNKPLPDLRAMTPAEIQGWKATGAGSLYGPKSVFDALNGGAEVYLDYRFRRVLIRRYQRPGRPELTVHLFDMGRAPDAFGIFSHERESEPISVGTAGEYGEGLLRFFKGRFFVSIHATRETQAAREAILALGRHIAARAPATGAPPRLVRYLPAKEQKAGSVRYVHTAPTLRHHLRQLRGNPLGLHKGTAVALAEYPAPKGTLKGLVVRYPKAGEAQQAARKLTAAARGVAHTRCERFLVAAVGGDSKAREALVRRMKRRVPACNAD
jgi:hypothetical protein